MYILCTSQSIFVVKLFNMADHAIVSNTDGEIVRAPLLTAIISDAKGQFKLQRVRLHPGSKYEETFLFDAGTSCIFSSMNETKCSWTAHGNHSKASVMYPHDFYKNGGIVYTAFYSQNPSVRDKHVYRGAFVPLEYCENYSFWLIIVKRMVTGQGESLLQNCDDEDITFIQAYLADFERRYGLEAPTEK